MNASALRSGKMSSRSIVPGSGSAVRMKSSGKRKCAIHFAPPIARPASRVNPSVPAVRISSITGQ